MKYFVVLLVIILGAIGAQLVPNDWLFIFGFIIGGIVQIILNS